MTVPIATTLPRHGALPEAMAVPDLLAPGLRLVFCGTALGRASAERRAYYAHPGNRFWKTLAAVGLTPERFAPSEYPRLLDLRIGLTDVCKTHFGNDIDLPAGAFDAGALRDRIRQNRPGLLAFTSKAAASACLGRQTRAIALGPQRETIGETRLFVLSSPSGNNAHWDGGASWRVLAEVLR